MSTEFSKMERFKSVLLDEANAREDLGLAYWWAKKAFPGRTSSEQIEATHAALRDLLDQSLIVLLETRSRRRLRQAVPFPTVVATGRSGWRRPKRDLSATLRFDRMRCPVGIAIKWSSKAIRFPTE